MLYRYILALTLSAMCTVNGEEAAATVTSDPSSTPSASPTNAPTLTQTVYLTQATETLPCCFFQTEKTVTDDNKCGATEKDACDADAFTKDSKFHGVNLEVTVAAPTKEGETCTCEYSFQRLEYTLLPADPADDFAARQMVSSDRWPNLLGYAEWTQGREAIEPVKDVPCDSMYVTECPAEKTCTFEESEDAAVNAKQLPKEMTIGEATKNLIDWGISTETWPKEGDNVNGEICFCFWLYRDETACPPTPAPTASPVDDVMTTVVDDDEETGGAANHSLTVAALIFIASAIFTAF